MHFAHSHPAVPPTPPAPRPPLCSYHSQDTHRSGLPVTMMMGGGAAMGGVHGPGSIAGSVIGRSNPPSVAGFPLEGSTRGAAAAAAMLRGSIHDRTGVSERMTGWHAVLEAGCLPRL